MKRQFKIIITSLLFILSISLSVNAQQTKVYRNIYKPLSNKAAYPKVFSEIDAKLQKFYETTYPSIIANNLKLSEYFTNMDSTEFMQWAKLAFQYFDAHDKYTFKFLEAPFEQQRTRLRKSKKNGIQFNEILTPKPDGIFFVIKRIIEKNYPWEWGLFLRSKYMLIVKVIDKEVGLDYIPGSNNPVRKCKVLDDMKGNYNEKGILKIALRKSFNNMEKGGEYLVLIRGNDYNPNKIHEAYILTWDGADGKAAFKVDNGNILTPNDELHCNSKAVSVEQYKNHVRSFYNMINNRKDNNNEN